MSLDLATIASILAPSAAILAAAGGVARWAVRRVAAMSRTITALERAVELHDAQSRGVVLVLTFPGHPRSAIPLLREAGWTVCPYDLQPGQDLPSVEQFWRDLPVADVILLQGQDAAGNSRLAQMERFTCTLGAGAAVVAFTPSHTVRYAQELWRDADQSVTTTATAEAAVRSSVARRRIIQALQGVRPGGLAEARAALPGA